MQYAQPLELLKHPDGIERRVGKAADRKHAQLTELGDGLQRHVSTVPYPQRLRLKVQRPRRKSSALIPHQVDFESSVHRTILAAEKDTPILDKEAPQEAPGMPSTIAEVDKLFADGVESVTLTRGEWEAIQEISRGYFANGLEVSRAQREMERVKRISRPVWRACRSVAAQMRRAMEGRHLANPPVVAMSRVQDWEMRLRHSMDVSWADLPANHPKRMVDWRR